MLYALFQNTPEEFKESSIVSAKEFPQSILPRSASNYAEAQYGCDSSLLKGESAG